MIRSTISMIMLRDAFYEDTLKPLLFRLEPEQAHDLVHKMMRASGGIMRSLPYQYAGNDLQTTIAGHDLKNPIGLAAGFDKNARLVSMLDALGFGFAEIGSVTARQSQGNPRPRLFRLPDDQALINRMGLNGDGADAVSARLRATKPALPIAVNIAKTHDPNIVGDAAVEDILYTFAHVKGLDLIYVALNVSCPNTREGCMKQKEELSVVLAEMQRANQRGVPLFVKVSPDSSDQLLADILELAEQFSLHGFVCGNTTLSRENLKTPKERLTEIGNGGLSGKPLTQRALQVCKTLASQKMKSQQIIAVGGISSGEDAYKFIRAGADALEVYTGLIYRGPSLVRLICEELSALLKRDGTTMKEAIGADLKQLQL